MTRQEAVKMIEALPLPQDKKDELTKNLKNPTLTKEETKILIEIVDKDIAELNAERRILAKEEINVLRDIYAETKKGLDQAYLNYEKTMRELDQETRAVFAQAGDFVDKLQADDLKKKIMEK